jgi:hypothetical protein
MENEKKNVLFASLCEVIILKGSSGINYAGYKPGEVYLFSQRLEKEFNEFKTEFENNYSINSTYAFVESVQYELNQILSMMSYHFKYEIQINNLTKKELDTIEDFQWSQKHILDQCIDLVNDRISIFEREKKIESFEPRNDSEVIRFKLTKNAIVLYFNLLQKNGIIDNGHNGVNNFIERHFNYEGAPGEFKTIKSAKQLFNQFTSGERPNGFPLEKVLADLNKVQLEIESLIAKIESQNIVSPHKKDK